MNRIARTCLLSLLAIALSPLAIAQAPSPDYVKYERTAPLSPEGQQKVAQAEAVLLSAGETAAVDYLGTVTVVEAEGSAGGRSALGASDHDTIALDTDSQDATELAVTILHEVEHSARARAAGEERDPVTTQPPAVTGICTHAGMYIASAHQLCAFGDIGWYVSCMSVARYNGIARGWIAACAALAAAEGNPPPYSEDDLPVPGDGCNCH